MMELYEYLCNTYWWRPFLVLIAGIIAVIAATRYERERRNRP
jgi:hypothetical protein